MDIPFSTARKLESTNVSSSSAAPADFSSEEEDEQLDPPKGDEWKHERERNIFTDNPIFQCRGGISERGHRISDPDIAFPIIPHHSALTMETYQQRCFILEEGWQGSRSMPYIPGEGRDYERARMAYFENVKNNLREYNRIAASLANIDNSDVDGPKYKDLIMQTLDQRHEIGHLYFQNKMEAFPAYGSSKNNANNAIIQEGWGNSSMLRGMSFCEENDIAITQFWPPQWTPNPRVDGRNMLPTSIFTSKKACTTQAEAKFDREITHLGPRVEKEQIKRLIIELNDHRMHLSVPPPIEVCAGYHSPTHNQSSGNCNTPWQQIWWDY